MKFDEIREACGDGTGVVHLHLNRRPTGDKIRLARTAGPLGVVICCPPRGGTTAAFSAEAVLKFLDRIEREASE